MKTKRYTWDFAKISPNFRALRAGMPLTLGFLLMSCSGTDNFDLKINEDSFSCFGSKCGACTRVEGYIGVLPSPQNNEASQILEAYFSESGEQKNRFNGIAFGYYLPAWEKMDIGQFKVRASNGNEYLRNDGTSVGNYFSIRTISSLQLPKEKNALGDFFRNSMGGQNAKLMFLMDGPGEVKEIMPDGSRRSLAKLTQKKSNGSSTIYCLDRDIQFTDDFKFEFEADSVLAEGEVSSPGNVTLHFMVTPSVNPLLGQLCGADVWREDSPNKPTTGDPLLSSELLGMGVVGMPYELFQIADETRKKFGELQYCPVDEFAEKSN